MVNTLDSQSRSSGSRVSLEGTICCSLVRNNLLSQRLSQSLSPPRSIKGVSGKPDEILVGGGGRGVSSGWMSYLPQVQTESFFLFFFFYLILLTCKRLTKIMTISSVGFSSP